MITSTSPGLDTETVYLNVAGLADSVRTKLAGQTYWRRARYTAAGLLDTVDITGGGIAFRARKYVYATQFNLLTEIHLAGAITRLAYNKDRQDTSITFPGGDRIRKTFFPLHRATQISTPAAYNGTIARSIGFDSLGRIQSQFIGDGSTGNRYTYDGVGRLTSDTALALESGQSPPPSCDGDPPPIVDEFGNSCVGSGGATWEVTGGAAFTYDSASNRRDQGGTYLAGNRINNFASCTYATDNDGNVTSRTCGSQITTFFWSAESRLDSAVVGTQRVGFRYDAGGRLVRKDLNGTPQSYFLWDGANLLAELTATGTALQAEYSYYPGLDNPHAIVVGGQEYHAHRDGLGNVIALTDGAQGVSRTYRYDAWGKATGGTDFAAFNGRDRGRFKGALWLGPEVDLYQMRTRWYEAQSGRFLTEDPIGLDGGINVYAYAGNDPVNARDPLGLEPCTFLPITQVWICPPIVIEAYGGGGGVWFPPITVLGGYADLTNAFYDPRSSGGGGGGRPAASPPASPPAEARACSAGGVLRDGLQQGKTGAKVGWIFGPIVFGAIGTGVGATGGTVLGFVVGIPTGPGAFLTATGGGAIGAIEGGFWGTLFGTVAGPILGGAAGFLNGTSGGFVERCL